MPALRDLEIGIMFWAGQDPVETLRGVKALGVRAGQLGIPGDMPLEGAAEKWKAALAQEDFTVVTVFCSYLGESYADIPTVQQTPNQYSMGLYTIGSSLKTIVTPTTSLGQISSAVANVDFDSMSGVVPTLGLPISLTTNMMLTNYADSDFKTTLASLDGQVPVPGDAHLAAGDLARLDVVALQMLGDPLQPAGVQPCPLRMGVHRNPPTNIVLALMVAIMGAEAGGEQ